MPDQDGTQDGDKAGSAEPKSFTQDEVNRIVGQRVAEERAKTADYAELKRKADELANLKHQQLTREEQLTAEAAEARAQMAAYQARAQDQAIRAELRLQAVQRGIVDPDAAYLLANRAGLQVAEDGTVSGVDAALDALVAAKPYLVAAPPLSHAANVNPGHGEPAPRPVQLTPQQRAAAQAMGIPEADYAKHVTRQ